MMILLLLSVVSLFVSTFFALYEVCCGGFLSFSQECVRFETGSGLIDGHGYDWWWFVILTGIDKRPHMLGINSSEKIEIYGLTFLNSPQFHLYLTDVKDVLVDHINVTVEVGKKQL
jgi:hypothetical protein